MMHPKDKH